MALRLVTAAVLALGVAGFSAPVSAQIFLPGLPLAVNPPPADIPDEEDDLVEAAPQIQSQPLAAPDGRATAPSYTMPGAPPQAAMPPQPMLPPGVPARGSDPMIAPAPPVELTAPVVVPLQPAMPPAAAARPSDNAPRPPASVDAEQPTAGLPTNILPPEYQPETGAKKELPPHLRRQMVEYWTKEPAGTIIIDTPNTYLYFVTGEGKAMRYGIGVGREGFTWAGKEKISRMAEWPDWFPPTEMIERQPYLPRFMAGGESNPLGARALYIGKTLYRIHGTNQPSTIGSFVSSGCIRLVNDDIQDLYQRVKVGTKIVVLPGNPTAAAKPAPVASANPTPVAR
jgi:lipoprotein-anchoring transpeptidase ErfK/SrfK